MISTSQNFQQAVRNREPQIALLIFSDAIFSNEDIRVDSGIVFHDYFNTEEDLCVGQALSNEIGFTLYNDDRLLNNYAFGEFKATIGVRVQRGTYVQHGPSTLIIGGVEWIGSQSRPYLKRAGSAVGSQPGFPVKALAAYNGVVYAIGANSQVKAYTTGGGTSSVSLNAFMKKKMSRWENVGYYLNGDTLAKWSGGRAEVYEFCPLGIFSAVRPDAPDKIEIDFTCYDRMQKLEERMNTSNFVYPFTAYQALTAVCSQANIQAVVSSSALQTTYLFEPPKEFENGVTMRKMVEWLAEVAGCNAKFNRDGKLVMKWVGSGSARTYNEGYYANFDPYWYTTQRVTGVITRSLDLDEQYVSGSEDCGYLVQDNPFLKIYPDKLPVFEDGPWKQDYDWEENEYDDEWYWSTDRVYAEFGIEVKEEQAEE